MSSGRDSLIAGAGLVSGFLVGLVSSPLLRLIFPGIFNREIKAHVSENDDEDEDDEICSTSAETEPSKLVFCVRTDLKMQKGKIAAQVGHATLGAFKAAKRKNAIAVQQWEQNAQPKIALQVNSAEEANLLEQNARWKGLTTYKVFDAGRTQIAAGSMTVLAIGPGPVSVVNEVTGHLKLL